MRVRAQRLSSPCFAELNTAGTKFSVEPGLTTVKILDFTPTKHINFEADIHLPEDEGIVQVETFGVSMNQDGTVYYGMQVGACARGCCWALHVTGVVSRCRSKP
jgi:hypothetical protein